METEFNTGPAPPPETYGGAAAGSGVGGPAAAGGSGGEAATVAEAAAREPEVRRQGWGRGRLPQIFFGGR